MFKRMIAGFLVFALLLAALPGCKNNKNNPEEDNTEDVAETVSGEPLVDVDFASYQQSFMPDIVREVSASDLVRNKTYTVDDAKLETLIETLDFAVGSKEFKDLLGMDLGETLLDAAGLLYTDSIVNLAVQYLYPLVEKEFAKVWAGLPETLDLYDVETGVSVAPKANVTSVLYINDIEQSLEAIDFYLFPTVLADHLPEGYEKAAEKLRLATTKSSYDPETDTMTTPWEDEAILDSEGKLAISWGVHDRQSFIDAMSAALCGVEPLLLALLSNVYCDKHGTIGTGEGKAIVAGGAVKLDMNITDIELVLTATANPGYNNALVPIFEALGVTPPDGNTFTCIRDFVEKGLIEVIEAVLQKLADAPVSFLLDALPNLAYAVEAQLVAPLLSMLRTEINYTSNAKYTVKLAGDGELKDAYKCDEPIRINVGEMIDLESMGLDLSSLNGLLKLAEKMLEADLPEIDGKKLATLGELTWRDTVRSSATYRPLEAGKAAYIKANRADVLLFLFDYVFAALKDKALLDGILNIIGGKDSLPKIVTDIIDHVLANPNNVIAALTEIVIPQEYEEPKGMKWKPAAAPVNTASALYNDYWTSAKAEYMTQNLPSLVDNVLKMADLNIGGVSCDSLPALLDGVVASICKAETLNGLAAKIKEALSGISLPDALADLLKEKVGLDLKFWNNYHADFADGDRAAFKTAVANMLNPVQKVLGFLLSDEDITVSLTGGDGETRKLVHLHGANGYALAVLPLLEALGAPNLPAPAAFRAEPGKAVNVLLDAVFGVVDGLKADPYNGIVSLLPNLIVFIRYGGLTSVVDNLLYCVNLALNTIRPIYDLNIYSLVDFDLRFEKTDPVKLLGGLVTDLLKEKMGLSLTLDLTTEKVYNGLVNGTIETFTSLNGDTAYRVNAESINKEDFLTVIYDYLLREIVFTDQGDALLAFAKEKLDLNETIFGYVEKVMPALKSADETYPGSGKALVFWVFFAAEAYMGASNKNGGSGSVFTNLLTMLGSGEKRSFAMSELQKDFSKPGFSDALTTVLQPLFRS